MAGWTDMNCWKYFKHINMLLKSALLSLERYSNKYFLDTLDFLLCFFDSTPLQKHSYTLLLYGLGLWHRTSFPQTKVSLHSCNASHCVGGWLQFFVCKNTYKRLLSFFTKSCRMVWVRRDPKDHLVPALLLQAGTPYTVPPHSKCHPFCPWTFSEMGHLQLP